MNNEQQVIQLHMDVFSCTEDVSYDWYNNRNMLKFGGVSPREMVEMDGYQEVLDYLNQIDNGFW